MPPSDPAPFSPSHHELSLHAYVSSARFNHVLKVLTNLCAMKEQKFTNHHLIYKPVRPANLPPSQEVYYMQLWSRVEDEAPLEDGQEQKAYDPRQQKWVIRVDDLPEVSKRPVVSRTVLSANTGTGDVMGFVELMGYVLQASFFSKNLQFVLGNVVLQMSQILVPTDPNQPEDPSFSLRLPPKIGDPHHPEKLYLVDKDGGWMMEAHVKVVNNTDVEAVNLAFSELEHVREQLAGVVNLSVVERLAFDTRCRT